MRLENKIAVVTGGANGLGKEMALRFASEGAKVVAVDMAELDYKHDAVEGYQLNVTDTVACKEFYDYVIEKYGQIDILVNNAGITRDSMTIKMTDEQWDLVIDVNLKGVFNLTRYVGPQMENIGGGSIINISSVVGEYGNIGQANYAATKAGVLGLTKTWAKEFARKGVPVRVNAIAPGYIMTDILKTVPQDLLDKFASMTMLKRLGQPNEIANVALFLASEEASYITGHTMSVNGGMRLQFLGGFKMAQSKNIGIVGTGIYLPQQKMSAKQIAEATEGIWAEEAVIEKLGIKEKYIANADEGAQEMSYLAAIDCLKNTINI